MIYSSDMAGTRVVILLLGVYGCLATDGPTVEHKIQDGTIRGTISYTLDNAVKPIYNFRGIPYATQPIGPLRFKPPQEVKPWEGVLDATQPMLECPQDYEPMLEFFEEIGFTNIEAEHSESCLLVSVYTPTLNENAKLPVMVWIHGGGLQIGSGRTADGTALTSLGDVVLVSINYRLGVLGMLSTNDDNAPGNQNFLDQVMALKWVQKNIASFGGDPSQVTIFGESAGSWSVTALSMSPLSKGLFNKGIGQSGSVAFAEAVQGPEMQKENVDTLASLAGCESENTQELVECLRTKPYMDLVKPKPLKEDDPEPSLLWMPTYGETFFPKQPMELIEDKDIQDQLKGIKFIIGVNGIEGYMFTKSPEMMPTFYGEKTIENFRQDLPIMLMMGHKIPPPSEDNKAMYDALIDAFLDQYMPVTEPTEDDMVKAAGTMAGAVLLQAPAIRTANKWRELGVDVKFYVLNKGPSYLKKFRPSFIETDHADDLMFCFGLSHMNNTGSLFEKATLDEDDLHMENMIFNYWLNFVKTGDPNGPNLPLWPASSKDGRNTAISLELQPTVIDDYGKEDAKLFSETIPQIVKDNTPEPENIKEDL